ncbi:hypothetical protein CVD28_14550 [Bacillus sp. M6-12]|uniref:ankyrin repeat domain-containing protein n=1 Tax=Bacillus sp. M6-12 TaxID=2054166 RepID=UPI000C78C576|nr:ankyrin repeat domain-containing protein [Bacillus sp. M6-12]PLS16873.1 hypothetical protein CVD28_14550 [Bacillus sp. M6-12]
MNKKILISALSGILLLAIMVFALQSFGPASKAKQLETEKKLFQAIKDGNKQGVKKYTGALNDEKVRSEEGMSPLEYALLYQNFDIADYILEKGGTVDRKSKEPLFVSILFSFNYYKQDEGNISLQKEKIDLLQTALKLHIDELKKTNDLGNNALHIASLKGETQMIHLLMKKGLSADKPNKLGETPLFLAVQQGNSKAVELLLESEPELIKGVDKEGNSLLHTAIMNGRDQLLPILLNNRDIVNHQNNLGLTPLMLASDLGNDGAVKLLLNKGSDKELVSKDGLTAMDYARKWNHEEVEELLVDIKQKK